MAVLPVTVVDNQVVTAVEDTPLAVATTAVRFSSGDNPT